MKTRNRLRELGIEIGRFKTGKLIKVGHDTISNELQEGMLKV